jgi:hypothetical protein
VPPKCPCLLTSPHAVTRINIDTIDYTQLWKMNGYSEKYQFLYYVFNLFVYTVDPCTTNLTCSTKTLIM